MKSLKGVVAGLFILGICLAAAPAAANEGKLIGKWQIDRVVQKDGKEGRPPAGLKVTMEFKKDHSWIGTIEAQGRKKEQHGSWTLQGKTLTTRAKGKGDGKGVDTMTVAFVGKLLELTKKGQSSKLVLKRAE